MQELIDQYEAGATKLRFAIQGLPKDTFDKRPGPGDWSIRELIIHMADSDSILINRMKMVIAENDPPLVAFDENLFIQRLHTDSQEIEDALQLFEVGRRQFTRVLRRLRPDEFQRAGVHSERGRLTLADLLHGAVNHLEHHLQFLVAKRERF